MRLSLPSPALVISCIALLLAMGGVTYAATGSSVNLVDPANATYKARVDSLGMLHVGDGLGPLTVDGTVSSHPAAPVGPWHISEDISAAPTRIAGPSAIPINLTSLSVSTDTTTGIGIHVSVSVANVSNSATSCTGANLSATIWQVRNLGNGVISFTFPTPLQWKPAANTKACLFVSTNSPYVTTMNAVGFYGS
jgi:hypothetical protein